MLLSYLYVRSPTRTHPTPLCEGPLRFLIPPFQTDKGIIERLRGATSRHKCSELNPHHLLREPVWSTSWRQLPISIASMWNTLSIVTVQNDNCVATTCFQRDANCNLWKKKKRKEKNRKWKSDSAYSWQMCLCQSMICHWCWQMLSWTPI